MLTNTLGSHAANYNKAGNTLTGCTYNTTETPNAARALRVSHEVAKNGKQVNTLFALTKQNPATATELASVSAIQLKFVRPSSVTTSAMEDLLKEMMILLLTGEHATIVAAADALQAVSLVNSTLVEGLMSRQV
jgi:hypothetical protein